jgi:ankyrin repeat protein
LIEAGSNVNEVDGLHRNSLYYAIYHNSNKTVKFLLQNKSLDKSHVDTFGKNAIHYVVNPLEYGSYENVDILESLKEAGYDINLKDKEG